jgi:hypothetical protein
LKNIEYQDKIIKLYENDKLTIFKISELLKISRSSVYRIIKLNNINTNRLKRYNGIPNTKYKIVNNFFEKIDNSIKSYILGLLYADGTMYKNKNNEYHKQVRLKLTDIDLLEDVNKALNYDKPLLQYKKEKEHHKDFKVLIICNHKIYDDLIKIGIYKNKTFDCKLPVIDDNLMHHFIRGFFDGDGTIYHNKKNNAGEVSFVGTDEMCNDICEYLNNVLKINSSVIIREKKYSKGISTFRMRRKNDIIKFYNYIYNINDNDIFLERKKEKFEQWFQYI